MKQKKREHMLERQKHIVTLYRNRRLLKVNILILSFGLALSYIGKGIVGKSLLWTGIGIFLYIVITNYVAKTALKKM